MSYLLFCVYNKNMELEKKDITLQGGQLEIKGVEDGVLNITGYAAHFGNVDSYRDIIDPKAFDRFLNEKSKGDVFVCYCHNIGDIIGTLNEIKVDSIGLYVDFDINATSRGKDVAILIKSGQLKAMSIGYYAIASDTIVRDGKECRLLKEVELVEFSIVPRPANKLATINSVRIKSEELQSMTDSDLKALYKQAGEEIYNRFIYKLKF